MTKLFALLAVLAALAWAVTATASWITRKRAPIAITIGSTPAVPAKSAEDQAMLMAQLRAVSAVVFSVAVFLVLFRVSIALTGLVGLPLALTAGSAASAGLLLYSALPPSRMPAAARSTAALTPRKPWSFGKRRTFLLPLTVVAAYAAFLLATGLTSSPDEQGRFRSIEIATENFSAAAGPYPGWYYGIPLILVTVALAGSTYLALRRISSSPSLPDPLMAALDRAWRETSTRVVVRLATGALLGYFGGTAVVAGQAMINVASSVDGTGPVQPLLGLGIASAAVGAALALAGVVLLVLAARGALTIRATVRQRVLESAVLR